jgi:hypothetical protein
VRDTDDQVTARRRVDRDVVASGLRGAAVLVDLGRLVADHALGQGPDVRVVRQPGCGLGHVDATLVVPRKSPEGLDPPPSGTQEPGLARRTAPRTASRAQPAPPGFVREAQYAYVLTIAEGREARRRTAPLSSERDDHVDGGAELRLVVGAGTEAGA